jgi:hypothetical protein
MNYDVSIRIAEYKPWFPLVRQPAFCRDDEARLDERIFNPIEFRKLIICPASHRGRTRDPRQYVPTHANPAVQCLSAKKPPLRL